MQTKFIRSTLCNNCYRVSRVKPMYAVKHYYICNHRHSIVVVIYCSYGVYGSVFVVLFWVIVTVTVRNQ